MLRVLFAAALVLLFAATGVGAVSATVSGSMTGTEFVNNATDGVITLTGDVTLTSTAEVTSNLKINLAGHTLTGPSNAVAINVTGDSKTLTFSDSSSSKTGKVESRNENGRTLFVTTDTTSAVKFEDIESPFNIAIERPDKKDYYVNGLNQNILVIVEPKSTIKLLKNVTTSAKHSATMAAYPIKEGVTFDGLCHELTFTDCNASTHVLGVNDVPKSKKVIIKDVTINLTPVSYKSGNPYKPNTSHCINIINSTVDIINVTVMGSHKAGVTISGTSNDPTDSTAESFSNVFAYNLHTENNDWGGVDVDSKNCKYVSFTFDENCVFGEGWKVWAETANVLS